MGWPHGHSPLEVRFHLCRVPTVFSTLTCALLRDTQSFLCRSVPVGSYSSGDLVASFGNRGLSEGLLPLLRHNSFKQNFCQGHTLNGCGAKFAANLDAKVGLFILADPRQHQNCVFSIFIILTSLRL